jgi:hypothetical protein
VCGRFDICNNTDKFEHDCEYLLRSRKLFDKVNLGVNCFDVDFNYTDHFAQLNGLVLCAKGFNYKTNKVFTKMRISHQLIYDYNFLRYLFVLNASILQISISKPTNKIIKKKDSPNNEKMLKPPKYALVNNLYYGRVPTQLKELTCIEEAVIARCRVKCSIFKIICKFDNNTSQYKLCGNVITYPQNPDNLLTLLPLIPSRENFQVIFVGTIQPTETKIKQILRVRRTKIYHALVWLKKHNNL